MEEQTIGQFTVESKVVRTTQITDRNGNPLADSSAEAKFAKWLLDVLEKGWLARNESLSGFSPATRNEIVATALNSEPKGLAAFRKNDPSYNNYGFGRPKAKR